MIPSVFSVSNNLYICATEKQFTPFTLIDGA